MSRATTAREALVAELIGDLAELLDRLERLTPAINEARQEMTDAAWSLGSRIEAIQAKMTAAAENSETVAVRHIAQRLHESSEKSVREQKEAMTLAAREIIKEEVRPPLVEFAKTLQGLVARANRPWAVWWTYVATAGASAAGSAWLVLHFMGR